MATAELQQTIITLLDKNPFASFATVEEGKPKIRYMALFHEGTTIYLATDRRTHKVEELESNPHVFLLVGYEQGGSADVLAIEATGRVSENAELKRKVWRDEFKQWLDGPEDPNYVVLQITPSKIEVTLHGDREPRIWKV